MKRPAPPRFNYRTPTHANEAAGLVERIVKGGGVLRPRKGVPK
jgi:hypothetical protein